MTHVLTHSICMVPRDENDKEEMAWMLGLMEARLAISAYNAITEDEYAETPGVLLWTSPNRREDRFSEELAAKVIYLKCVTIVATRSPHSTPEGELLALDKDNPYFPPPSCLKEVFAFASLDPIHTRLFEFLGTYGGHQIYRRTT